MDAKKTPPSPLVIGVIAGVLALPLLLCCMVPMLFALIPTSTDKTPLGQSAMPTATSIDSPSQVVKNVAPTPDENYVFAKGGTAILGGTQDAFGSQWGKPNTDIGGILTPSYDRNCDDTGNAWCLNLQFDFGSNSQMYVTVLDLGVPQGERWTPQRAQAICESYIPNDAAFIKKTSQVMGNRFQGYHLDYFSQHLAARFAASAFFDDQHDPVRPGTFEIYYSYDITGSTVNECSIYLGTSQSTQ